MEDMLRELIEFVKSASPMIWETFQRQVQVQIFQLIFWAVVLSLVGGACAVICYKTYKKVQDKKDESYYSNTDDVMIMLFSALAALAGLAIGLINVTDAVSRMINPDFYTIQLILEQIR